MKGAQQVVKVLAIIFAVFLVCGIGAAFLGVGALVGNMLESEKGDRTEWTGTVVDEEIDFRELDIEVEATNVRIEVGREFQVMADEEAIEVRHMEDKLEIEEKDLGLFGGWHEVGGELKVVLPRGMDRLEKVTIKTGAGTVYAEEIVAEEVRLDLGAGRAEFLKMDATDRVKIDSGAGYLKITEADLRNLDLDMGVGKVEIAGKIRGESRINAGVGKLEMALKGDAEDYRMEFSRGLGAMTVNGEKMGDDNLWGRGKNVIKIDGGVGAVEVRVEK